MSITLTPEQTKVLAWIVGRTLTARRPISDVNE